MCEPKADSLNGTQWKLHLQLTSLNPTSPEEYFITQLLPFGRSRGEKSRVSSVEGFSEFTESEVRSDDWSLQRLIWTNREGEHVGTGRRCFNMKISPLFKKSFPPLSVRRVAAVSSLSAKAPPLSLSQPRLLFTVRPDRSTWNCFKDSGVVLQNQ